MLRTDDDVPSPRSTVLIPLVGVWLAVLLTGCSGVSTTSEQATQRGSIPTQQRAARATHATHPATESPVDKGGVSVVEPPPADEPTYQGIPMSKWVRALKDKDKQSVERAFKALVAIGEPAEEAIYQAYENFQTPATTVISVHYQSKGEKGVPFFARAVRDKSPRAALQAASALAYMHTRQKCLPSGSDLRKDVEKVLENGRQSTDAHEKRIATSAIEALTKTP